MLTVENANYIIHPSVFYWINVLSIIQTVLAVFGAFVLTGSLCLTVSYIYKRLTLSEPDKMPEEHSQYDIERYQRYQKDYDEDVKRIRMIRRWMIATAAIGLIMIIACIFIPSRQTSVEMLVARTATFDNLNWTVEQVKEIIDYIVNALKEVS